ncbi:PAS domain-containing sensor histidine kinase [Variovorax sp. OV329]|uniref:hybrid sensor histidine kinase/response regulator n=1 Tax=Variovorax sp. OV329 TaxID=1882825 RepID=UPI0011139928|nr:ATP-binding protein [Variovorax sp. OV329]
MPWPLVPGDAAARIRTLDEVSSPLGSPEQWPSALRTVVDLMLPSQAQIVLFWGPEYCALYNDAYAPTIGDKNPRALGRPACENWSELWDDLRPLLDHVRTSGETFAAADRPFQINRHGAMEQVFFDISYSAVRMPDGAVGGVLCIVSETTTRVNATRQLAAGQLELVRAVQERTRDRDRLWQLSTDLLVVTSLEGDVLAVNPAWRATLGWEESELLGSSILDRVAPDEAELAGAELARLARGESTAGFECRLRHADGSFRLLSWTAVPDDRFVHAVGRDVTAIRAGEQRSLHSQKMEAIGQLTGGIAHDFNNMLQGITGAIEVIRRRVALGRTEDLDRFLETASSSAQRAAALVQRLLAFSRRQSLDSRPVDVNELIGSMVELMHRSLGEQVRLSVEPANGPAMAICDESQLESAILNLAINARDAMPEGGRLTISTEAVKLVSSPQRAIDGLAPGDYVAVRVSDTGTGMTPAVLQRAFDPFFTTKPIGQGTGLGLSMVYGFAQQSHGQVHIESQPGHGTTVALLLPQAARAPSAAKAAVLSPLPHGNGELVLVVEDDPSVRLFVLEVLGEHGYRTLEAPTADAALTFLVAPELQVDLLLTDVGLPGMNGRQLAEQARQSRPELPILFMTGYAEYARDRAAFLGRGMQMISKPFAIEEFVHRLRRMLDKRGHA